jgi:palmitoyltransferase
MLGHLRRLYYRDTISLGLLIVIYSPFLFLSITLYFIVRFKNPGTIPIVKAEIPIDNN